MHGYAHTEGSYPAAGTQFANKVIMSRLSQAKILEFWCGRIVVSYNGKKVVRY